MKMRLAHTLLAASAALLLMTGTRATVAAQQGAADIPQYLSLPMHPRPQADGNGNEDNLNANGIYRRGSHFIWQAPLVNGQPPGQTLDNAPLTPAAPVAAADSTGVIAVGGAAAFVSTSATGPYHGETGAAALSNGVIIGGSNRIYPGGCDSNP